MIASLRLALILAATATTTGLAKPDEPTRNLMVDVERNLQNCDFAEHGFALECIFATDGGNEVRYLVPCPVDANSTEDCLSDEARLCYQYNSVPCIGSYYCMESGSLALDCSNIFAADQGNSCSTTNCDGTCMFTADTPVDYNTADLDNACFRSGLSYLKECDDDADETTCTVTNEWYDILADGTEIRVTGTRPDLTDAVFDTCEVVVAGDTEQICSCSTDCPEALSYDCSAFSNDICAITDCDGNCLNDNGGSAAPNVTLAPTPSTTTAAPSQKAAPTTPRPVNDWTGGSPPPTATTAAPAVAETAPNATLAPAAAPTTFPPFAGARECTANEMCNERNLTGLCCPTIDDVFLYCCFGETPSPSPSPVDTPAPVSTTTSSPTTSPVVAETSAPTASPVASPITTSPVVAETSPPMASPTPPVAAKECAANTVCAALNLEADCCPTIDNWMLNCCDGVELAGTCEENPGCVAAGVSGDCCPTNDGFGYLDCCDAVGDECLDGNCTFTETSDYLEFVTGSSAAAREASEAWQRNTVVASMGVTVLLTVLSLMSV